MFGAQGSFGLGFKLSCITEHTWKLSYAKPCHPKTLSAKPTLLNPNPYPKKKGEHVRTRFNHKAAPLRVQGC